MTTETIYIRLKKYKTDTGKSITRIALESGLSKENLYKWVKGTKISDPEDYRKLESYLNFSQGVVPKMEAKDLESIPTETLINDPDAQYQNKIKKNFQFSITELNRLDKLIDANHMLSKANMDLSETTVIMARDSSSGDSDKKGVIVPANRGEILGSLVKDLTKDGTFHTPQEAAAVLDRILTLLEKKVLRVGKKIVWDK